MCIRDSFPITEPVIEGAATRVMSLRDGTKKMSKSDPSDASRINLTDEADTIAQKFRKAKTDAEPLPDSVEGLKDRPDARNLVNIFAALADETPQSVLSRFAGQGFGAFKPALVEVAAVSYTHLDVYKRQSLNLTLIRHYTSKNICWRQTCAS